MNTLSRDADPFLSTIEALTHPDIRNAPVERVMGMVSEGAFRALLADQTIVAFGGPEASPTRVVSCGETVDACQHTWLEGRLSRTVSRETVELVGRERWNHSDRQQPCLGPRLRSGAVLDLPGGAVLLVCFRADHLFSDRELGFLRTLGHIAGDALRGADPRAAAERPAGACRPRRLVRRAGSRLRETNAGADRAESSDSAGRARASRSSKRMERDYRQRTRQRLQVQEAERKRIAAELHDGVGQSLTAVKFALDACLLEHGRCNGRIPRKALTDVLRKVQASMDEVRRVALDLRPAMLDDLGLGPTLRWFCREFGQTYHPLRLRTRLAIDDKHVDPAIRVAIYRIAQEALNNVAKHARAREVQLRLELEGERMMLRIIDDGVGLDDGTHAGGLGIGGMRERAAISGGEFTIFAATGGGTVVEASWPLNPEQGRIPARASAVAGVVPGRAAPGGERLGDA